MSALRLETMDTDLKTRYLGCCQICEQEQKLHGGKLVHHGYKRPGWGEIVGDCYGVHADPYEVSCELVKTYLGQVQGRLENVKNYLARLEGGQVTFFTKEERVGGSWSKQTQTVQYALGVTELWSFKRELDSRISETKYQVRQLEAEVTRLQNRITNWKPAAIRTIEEKAAEEKAAREVRAAEREAACQAKAAKVAATKAKQEALAAKRQAIMDDFKTKFIALAAEGNKAKAVELVQEMNKKKYSFFYARELEIDETFITLGLAERDARDPRWVNYKYPLA